MGWHVLVITPRKREAAMKFFEDNSCPSFKCRRIDDLCFFLEKIAEAMKAVSYIMEDDTMLQISGVPPDKVFFFRPKTVLSWTSLGQQQADYGSSRYRSGDLVAYQGLFPDKEDPCRILQADDRRDNIFGCIWPIH